MGDCGQIEQVSSLSASQTGYVYRSVEETVHQRGGQTSWCSQDYSVRQRLQISVSVLEVIAESLGDQIVV